MIFKLTTIDWTSGIHYLCFTVQNITGDGTGSMIVFPYTQIDWLSASGTSNLVPSFTSSSVNKYATIVYLLADKRDLDRFSVLSQLWISD